MKLTELIGLLCEAYEDHGDLDVVLLSKDCWQPVSYLGSGEVNNNIFYWLTSEQKLNIECDEDLQQFAAPGSTPRPKLTLVK